MSFKILGTGSYAPQRVLTNDDLSQMVETSDEWIMKRIGVKRRHVSVNESAVDMGVKSAHRALENAGVDPSELDLIIGTTITSDHITPGLACMVQNKLGATCPAFDVTAACSGFVFALDTAAGFFERKAAKKVLVVSSERMSGITDWTDRSTCCIFGDGSGAVVLGEGDGYICSTLTTKGGDDILCVPVKSDKSPFYENELRDAVVYMNGQETYKFAVVTMSTSIRETIEKAGLKPEDITAVIPHQANYRIINEARRRLPEIDPDKFYLNIDEYGNTSSASVPLLLDEVNKSGKIKKGDYVVLAAFGGGLSSGVCIIKW